MKSAGDGPIGLAWVICAAGVIMSDDKSGGAGTEEEAEDISGVDGALIGGAFYNLKADNGTGVV